MKYSTISLFVVGCFCAHTVAGKLTKLVVQTVTLPDDCKPTSHKSKFGQLLRVHFRSWIDEESETGERNTKVEDSYAYASGAEFILGQGEVPKAWDIGLQNMCIGESRVIRSPPEFAFGSYALGNHVPGNATLKYQFDLVEIDPAAKVPNHFENFDKNKDGYVVASELEEILAPHNETHLVPVIMEDQDIDGDSKISFAEFRGQKGFRPISYDPTAVLFNPTEEELAAVIVSSDADAEPETVEVDEEVIVADTEDEAANEHSDAIPIDKDEL